mgnify:CR=1 FL=1
MLFRSLGSGVHALVAIQPTATMFEKVVVVDCRAHLLGRLASVVAKQILTGQHVVLVRCEAVNISGGIARNEIKFQSFLRKRHHTNPQKHGPFHHKAPSKIVWRCIRGMVPHKTARGTAAMARLKTFEGIPAPYDKMKRMVIPDALRVTRLRTGRSFCVLGEVAEKIGWTHAALVERLEASRKVASEAYYVAKKAAISA